MVPVQMHVFLHLVIRWVRLVLQRVVFMGIPLHHQLAQIAIHCMEIIFFLVITLPTLLQIVFPKMGDRGMT